MRVLVVTTPGLGHLYPTLPVALAARDAGHTVAWATHAEAHPTLRAFGFETHPVGIPRAERVRRSRAVAPELARLPPRERRPLAFTTLFARVTAPETARDLALLVAELAPDLVVHEAAELASPPVATARGIPYATVGFGGAIPPGVLEAAAEPVAALWAEFGLAAPANAGLYEHCYLHPFPPRLGAPPAVPTIHPVRPSAVDATATPAPDWCDALGRARPFVYVTFGTEMAEAAPWRACIDGLADLDVDAVCTVGRAVEPGSVGPLPTNVRVEQFVPQQHLLPRASVMVSHAGSGSLLGAAAASVPQVCVPSGADQFENADALARAGAGITVDLSEVDAKVIRDAVGRLLVEPAFTDAARTIADEIAAMPSPADCVPLLEGLVARA